MTPTMRKISRSLFMTPSMLLSTASALYYSTTYILNLADFCCDRIFEIKIGSNTLVWLALPHEPTGDRNPHYQKVLSEKLPVVA